MILQLAGLISEGCRAIPTCVDADSYDNDTIMDLCKSGYIKKLANGSIMVTDAGYRQVLLANRMIQEALHTNDTRVIVKGVVTSGMGRGSHYTKRYAQRFRDVLGIDPYPGTLNLRLDEPSTHVMQNMKNGCMIPRFKMGDTSYGAVRCFAGILQPDIPCYIVRPDRTTHHTGTAEIISDVNIRETISLRDGMMAEVSVGQVVGN